MGKVISLKMNKEEEQLVAYLKKKGYTPSQLIREALWDYVENHKDAPKRTSSETTEQNQDPQDAPYLDKYLNELEKEVNYWKIKYENLESYWKMKYAQLEETYRDHMHEAFTQIDEKFDVIMSLAKDEIKYTQISTKKEESTNSQTNYTTTTPIEEGTRLDQVNKSLTIQERIDHLINQKYDE